MDIDSIAGPSEVVSIADWPAVPAFAAADLTSHAAEYRTSASILLTWEQGLIIQVSKAFEDQLPWLGWLAFAGDRSLEWPGALSWPETRTRRSRSPIRRARAPSTCQRLNQVFSELPHSTNAGAIFLGHFAPVAAGDYAAGPSHVLPTGGTARWASGLSVNDFLKRSSLIALSRDGLAALAPDIRLLADKEGLSAHRSSVDLRLEHPSGRGE